MKKDIKHILALVSLGIVFAAAAFLAPATPLPPQLHNSVDTHYDPFSPTGPAGTSFVRIALHDIGPKEAPDEEANPLLKESGFDRLAPKRGADLIIQPSMLSHRPPDDLDLDDDRRGRRHDMGIGGLRSGLNGNVGDALTEKPSWGWLADDVFSSGNQTVFGDDYTGSDGRNSR